MDKQQPTITETILRRFSCRTYLDSPIEEGKRRQLEQFLASLERGPLGAPARFKLVAASERDRSELAGLGTYGFIRDAPAFVIGAVGTGEKRLEDFGYLMEQAILFATELELGTCWLGGTFNKSRFARKLDLRQDELMPAVSPVGTIADKSHLVDRLIRRGAGSDKRRPWEQLFFRQRFGQALSQGDAAPYAVPLEMVRRGPSASNRQPWRIIRDGPAWHFYLQRTPGYKRTLRGLLKMDLQRVDMGIAMCHFALTARQLGLSGKWAVQEPGIARPDGLTEYSISWVED